MYTLLLNPKSSSHPKIIYLFSDLGPPGLSSKYKPNDPRGSSDRRDSRRGDSRDRGRDRRDRSRSRDRDSRRGGGRDDYDRYPPRDNYRGGGGGGYGAPRLVVDPSYYPRYFPLSLPVIIYRSP